MTHISIKKRIRRLIGPSLQRVGYSIGVMGLMARLRQINGAIILMYHSVADDSLSKWIDPDNHVAAEVFAQQMEFLSKNRKVVSLSDLIATLKEGRTPVDGTVVITFDDGYLDNLSVAAPILDRYGLPALLFLPSAYIDRGENQWIDQAYTAFKFRTNSILMLGSNPVRQYDLDNSVQNRAGYKAVWGELLSASAEERKEILADLYRQLQPAGRSPQLSMSWDDVRTLLKKYKGFQIGGHTAEHTDLTSVSDEKAKEELAICSKRIEDELNIHTRFFSYCYCRSSKGVRNLVAEAGFEAACGGGELDPAIKAPADLYQLPRVEVPDSMRRFDILTTSKNAGMWWWLGR
jgi:peptidoglycan/xylan/chitin deacetylase (PgdA/CDA1 family)